MQQDNSRKKIDELFGEGLSVYTETPPAYAWNHLSDSLKANKRKKRMIIWRYAAAILLIIGSFGIAYILPKDGEAIETVANNNTSTKTEVESPKTITPTKNDVVIEDNTNKIDDSRIKDNIPNSKTIQKNNPILASNDTEIILAVSEKDEQGIISRIRNLVIGEINNENKKSSLAYNTNQKYALLNSSELQNQIASFDERDKKYSQSNSDNDSERNKWLVGGEISPMYAYKNSSGEISNDMAVFTNNTKLSNTVEKPIASISLGMNAGYEIAPRLSIESGIYFSRFGHRNEDLWIEEDLNSKEPTYTINTSAGDIQMAGMPEQIKDQTINTTLDEYIDIEQRYGLTLEGQAQINVTQQFEYIEIPLLLKYRLNEGKIGIDLVGGISSGILVGNYSLYNGTEGNALIGETENIQNMLYNGVAGVGISYSLSKNIDINMEPMIKYSLSSISSDPNINYKPYSIGWYTGIKYKF